MSNLAGTEELLLNILIMVLSILIYFSIRLNPKYSKVTVAILSTATLMLCMSFPFSVITGYKYDLRVIPLLIGILYGGYRVGIVVGLTMIAYRYFLGGPGFILTLYSYPPVMLIAFCLIPQFREMARKFKYLLGSGLSLLWALICTFISFSGPKGAPVTQENIIFYIGFCLLHALAMWIVMVLIESLSENEKMRMEIQRTEKLNALSQLAASIAHEIRNPMTVVRGFMQLLNERERNETERKYMKLMIDELDRAELIINNFLSLAKPQGEEIERFDVRKQVEHVVSVTSAYAVLRNVDIRIDMDGPLYILANPSKFNQVLLNLIKNGIEAMPEGGTLLVAGTQSNEQITIEVTDTGIGMSSTEVQQLGTPYYSTKKEGTGLGLLTSFRIVQMMNGKIEVKSQKGKGTRFSIRLPLEN